MRRSLLRIYPFALLAVFAACLPAQNVFVLPAQSSGSPNVAVFAADPFNATASPINLNPNSAAGYIAAATFVVPASNGKYYIVSNSSGSVNPTVVSVTQNPDGSFGAATPVAASLAGALDAVITPDGKWLYVVSGAGLVTLIDASKDTIAGSSLYYGGNVAGIAPSLDSKTVFILTNGAGGAHLSAVPAATGAIVNPVSIPGTATGLAVGPNGLAYASTQNGVLELDPVTHKPRFTFAVSGRPGNLAFTPDGKLGIAVNQTPSTGPALFVFDLVGHTVATTIPDSSFNGATLDQVLPVSNNRVFAYSSSADSLFDVTLNPPTVAPFQFATAGTVTGAAVSNDVASGSHASTQYLFFTSGNTIYRYDIIAGQVTGQQNLSVAPGALVFAAQPLVNGTPATILTYGDQQSISPKGTTGPLVVRVLDAQGRPLAGVQVTFSTTATDVTFSSATATTTKDGYATTTVTATTTGQDTITAKAATLTATFTVNIGGGSTGPSQAGCLTVTAGQGQMVYQNFGAQSPLTVEVTDPSGNPLSGQKVVFTLTGDNIGTISGGANSTPGSGTTQELTVITDDNGLASINFLANSLLPGGIPYDQTQISAQGPCGTSVTFYTTVFKDPQSAFISVLSAPTAPLTVSKGGKLVGAFKAAVGSTLGNVAHVGVFTESVPFPSRTDTTPAPPAVCDGLFALSDTTGTASCDLIATGKPGTYTIWFSVGYFSDYGPYTLVITAGAPSTMTIVSGNNQSGTPGQQLPAPLTVKVTDNNGALLSGAALTWTVVSGSATLTNTSSVTDSNGVGSAKVTLGNSLGPVQIKVSTGAVSQTFSLSIAAPVASMHLVSGGGQTAAASAPFAQPIVVQVLDAAGGPVSGLNVAFNVTTGAATLSSPTATTDAQGNASVNVKAGNTPGNVIVTATAGAISATAALTITGTGPTSLVFLNGAGFTRSVAPGSIVAIQGSSLVPNLTGVFTPNNIVGPLPTTLQGVTVTFNGVAAPIFSVSNVSGVQQVVVQAPYELAGSTSANVSITASDGGNASATVPIQPYAPGIFETTAFGARQIVAVHASDGTYVSPTSPAKPGENIIIFATGLGQTTPPLATDQAGAAGQKLANFFSTFVGIYNAGVPLVKVEAAPGLIGVYEMTITVPSDAAANSAAPINILEYDASGKPYYAQGSYLPIQ